MKEQYSVVELDEMGVIVPHYEAVNPDDCFNDHEEDLDKPQTKKIVLEYGEEEYEKVIQAIENLGGSAEQVVWKLLKLNE